MEMILTYEISHGRAEMATIALGLSAGRAHAYIRWGASPIWCGAAGDGDYEAALNQGAWRMPRAMEPKTLFSAFRRALVAADMHWMQALRASGFTVSLARRDAA